MRNLSEIKGFGPKRLEALAKRGINTSLDLVETLPTGYKDTSHPLSPAQMTEGRQGCFEGYIVGKPALHRAHGMQWVSAVVGDECGKVRCMWFNQPWMKNNLYETQHVTLYGRAVRKKNGVYVINPTMEMPGCITPVYTPVPGVGQKPLRDAVRELLEENDEPDELPASLREAEGLMGRREALWQAHFPINLELLAQAKERLAFEELLMFQMAVAGAAGERKEAEPLDVQDAWVEEFFASLPFPPTGAQRRAVADIAKDLRKNRAMARMVQVNYMGMVHVAVESFPYLKESRGKLLFYTSSSYTRGRAFYSLYSSTKAAVVNFVQAVAQEWEPWGIQVNCVNPERTKTPMRVRNFGAEDERTLLTAREVAVESLKTLLSDFTGQVIDVKLNK